MSGNSAEVAGWGEQTASDLEDPGGVSGVHRTWQSSQRPEKGAEVMKDG